MIQISPVATPNAQPTLSREPIEKLIPRQPDTNVAAQGSVAAPEAPATPEPDPHGQKFALLAKREKQLRSREEAAKAKEAQLAAKEAEYTTGYIPKSGLKEAAMAALKSGELSYDEFTQMMLTQPESQVDPVIRQIQAENAALKKKIEEIDGNFKQKQTTEYQQAVTQLGHDVKATLSGNQEFEMINNLNMHEKVKDLIVSTFDSENRMMSIEEAAKEIEDYLLEEAMRVTSIGKVKAKLSPPVPDPEVNPALKQPINQQQPMRTLTNSVTTSKPMSPRERAIAAFKGELK